MRWTRPRRRRPRGGFLLRLALLGCFIVFGGRDMLVKMAHVRPPRPAVQSTAQSGPVLTEARLQHILYGDASGGGHMAGMRQPCKSEFPASWSAQDIYAVVIKDAANGNLPWRAEDNGNYVADAQEGGVVIRIVLSPDRAEVITAYPVNTPRNPCPAHGRGE